MEKGTPKISIILPKNFNRQINNLHPKNFNRKINFRSIICNPKNIDFFFVSKISIICKYPFNWSYSISDAQGLVHTEEIAILIQFLAIEPHFVRKGCDGNPENRNFTSGFGDRTSFRAKGLFRTTWNRNFESVFDDRTSFRAKGLFRTTWNRNFTSVFGRSKPHFVRKGCVSCRLVGTAPRLQERNRKEGEGKRARGQEGKRARGQKGKRARGQEGKRRRCEDEKIENKRKKEKK